MPLKTLNREHATPRKGRGAGINPEGRFESVAREAFDDGWPQPPAAGEARGERRETDEPILPLKTFVTAEYAKSIISHNDSPDIPFTQSINPYRGCEHGCIYCYSRPSHAYLNLSPGVDFETRLFAKVNAAELLRRELAQPGYQCEVISLGSNTDPGFGTRMCGSGEFADLLRQRFDIACERLGYNNARRNRSLDTTRLRKPQLNGQLALF